MTTNWTGEDAADFAALAIALEARCSELAGVLSLPDIGLDSFYLQALHTHAGSIYDLIWRLAGAPADQQKGTVDSMFALQWTLAYVSRQLLRPLTLRFGYLLLRREDHLGERPPVPLDAGQLPGIDSLSRSIETKLAPFAGRNAWKKAEAIVLLAGTCHRARSRVQEMAAAKGAPLEDLHRVSVAAERMGWWVSEVYSWLHPLIVKLIYGGGGTKDDITTLTIKLKAEEWQRAKDRVSVLRSWNTGQR